MRRAPTARGHGKIVRKGSPATVRSLCILRLSALGDVTHVLPVIRRIQSQWPDCRLTWVIGKGEAQLLDGLDGVEFVVYHKRGGRAALGEFRGSMRGRRFDVLLHMQLALRANLLSSFIPARRRIGYDRGRSKEGHGLFINERIAPAGYHVLDSMQQFLTPLGIPTGPIEWRLPVPPEVIEWARAQWPEEGDTLLISPCASNPLRNWNVEGYAALASHALSRGWRVALSGGRTALERSISDEIKTRCDGPVIDLVGNDSLKRMIALLARADLVVAPDSGPVHVANAAGTPVLGLYACSDAERTGPYSDRRWTVNRYAEAVEKFMRRPVAGLRWGQRVQMPGVMDLVGTDEVIRKFDQFCAQRRTVPRDQAVGP
jgi:heptosyltransferase I